MTKILLTGFILAALGSVNAQAQSQATRDMMQAASDPTYLNIFVTEAKVKSEKGGVAVSPSAGMLVNARVRRSNLKVILDGTGKEVKGEIQCLGLATGENWNVLYLPESNQTFHFAANEKCVEISDMLTSGVGKNAPARFQVNGKSIEAFDQFGNY